MDEKMTIFIENANFSEEDLEALMGDESESEAVSMDEVIIPDLDERKENGH